MKIFLSYPSEELLAARQIYDFLTSLDLDVWFDKESLVVGQDWNRERRGAQRGADLTILLIGAGMATRSGTIHSEIKDALELLSDRPLGSLYLLPVVLGKAEISTEIAKFQYVKWESDWRRALVKGISLKFRSVQQEIPSKIRDFLGGNVERETSVIVESALASVTAYIPRFARETAYDEMIYLTLKAALLKKAYWCLKTATLRWTDYDELERQKKPDQYEKSVAEISVSERYRKHHFASYTMEAQSYFHDAAHGYHELLSVNFGGADFGEFRIGDILDLSDKSKMLSFRREISDAILHDRPDLRDHVSVSSFSDEVGEFLKQLNNFHFDASGVTFIFNPYEMASYADGAVFAYLSWRALAKYLNSQVKHATLGRDLIFRDEIH